MLKFLYFYKFKMFNFLKIIVFEFSVKINEKFKLATFDENLGKL